MEITSSTSSEQSYVTAVIITTSVCIVTMTIVISLVLSAVFCCICYRHRNRRRHSHVEETVQSVSRISSFQGPDCEAIIPQVETIDSLVQASLNFGNCSSLSLLIQRHIVKRTKLEKNIEKRQFFDKYSGLWRQERVLVKVYPPKYEALWFAETEMYQTPCMRHENIACFVAADILQKGPQLRHYVIIRHYERGSLAEHLAQTELDVPSALRLVESLASGLAHLHSELVSDRAGTVLKPAIAHRNISSRSIYVTDHGSCCLADFCLAVKNGSDVSAELRSKPLGDLRYQAPELLLEGGGQQLNIDPANEGGTLFEALKRADMYSFALVLWEVTRRCTVQGSAEETQLPYMDVTSEENASSAELQAAVCGRGLRPPVSERWSTNENLQVVVKVMTECWHGDPVLRNTSAQASKTLQNLVSQVKLVSDKNSKLLHAYNLS